MWVVLCCVWAVWLVFPVAPTKVEERAWVLFKCTENYATASTLRVKGLRLAMDIDIKGTAFLRNFVFRTTHTRARHSARDSRYGRRDCKLAEQLLRLSAVLVGLGREHGPHNVGAQPLKRHFGRRQALPASSCFGRARASARRAQGP